MAGSVNKVILLGNLGQDPVVRTSQDGNKIVQLSIATSERWKDRMSGEQRERTEWHRVVIFNEGLSNIAEQYLKKGSTVYIEGQLQTRKWQDQNGVILSKQNSDEIVKNTEKYYKSFYILSHKKNLSKRSLKNFLPKRLRKKMKIILL